MAQLSKNDVLKLAKLSRLRLSDEEVQQYQKEITAILGYVEQLQGLNLKDTEPTTQVTGLTNVMRPDIVKDYGTSSTELLKNAPMIEKNYLKVRRVL